MDVDLGDAPVGKLNLNIGARLPTRRNRIFRSLAQA
jgi:hypothetical protein